MARFWGEVVSRPSRGRRGRHHGHSRNVRSCRCRLARYVPVLLVWARMGQHHRTSGVTAAAWPAVRKLSTSCPPHARSGCVAADVGEQPRRANMLLTSTYGQQRTFANAYLPSSQAENASSILVARSSVLAGQGHFLTSRRPYGTQSVPAACPIGGHALLDQDAADLACSLRPRYVCTVLTASRSTSRPLQAITRRSSLLRVWLHRADLRRRGS